MIALVIFGLVSALVVLWSRAGDEIRRATSRWRLLRSARFERRSEPSPLLFAQAAELQAKEVLERSSHVDGDQDTSQKPPNKRTSVAPR